jgi:putative addiction module killer protein
MKTVFIYEKVNQEKPFLEWLNALPDKKTRAVVDRRLDRVALGLMGDCKSVGDDVYELRVHLGPGYRIYFAQFGATMVLLLTGGDKSRQIKDIQLAKAYYEDYRRRNP